MVHSSLAHVCVCLTCVCFCVCVAVEGQWYLAEDMRLLCYTGQWWGYAIYGITMIGVYVVGLPLGILLILSRHRATLYGPVSKETMRKYGFLYDTYGPNAWFWETEELFRKLMLTAVAVLMNPANPMQVCLRPTRYVWRCAGMSCFTQLTMFAGWRYDVMRKFPGDHSEWMSCLALCSGVVGALHVPCVFPAC